MSYIHTDCLIGLSPEAHELVTQEGQDCNDSHGNNLREKRGHSGELDKCGGPNDARDEPAGPDAGEACEIGLPSSGRAEDRTPIDRKGHRKGDRLVDQDGDHVGSARRGERGQDPEVADGLRPGPEGGPDRFSIATPRATGGRAAECRAP